MSENAKEVMGAALYNVLIHYNHHRDMWYSIPREEYIDYWQGTSANVLSHSVLDELIQARITQYLEEIE